jgi:hypothetical protein
MALFPLRLQVLKLKIPPMTEQEKDKLAEYFDGLKNLNADQLMARVDTYLDDDAIEIFVDHIEEFYGVDDDEELGMLAQLMVSGFIAAKELQKNNLN